MTTVITNKPHGARDSSGHNLAIALRYAGLSGGVKSITVHRMADAGRPRAFLIFDYANGARGYTYFLCDSHAVNWAHEQSAQSPRRSWWAGCRVDVIPYAVGAWDYDQNKPKE